MKYKTEDPEWVSFYPRFSSSLCIDKAGYFDERPQVHASVTQLIALIATPILMSYTPIGLVMIPFLFFGWGKLYIHLPIRTGIEDCESASWGFDYHNNKIWIYIGGGGNFEGGRKWKTITMPWDLTWVRTSTLMKDDWFHETKSNRLDWGGSGIGSYDWLESNKWKETHEYTDKYDGSKVNATISVKEREWRPLWFMWTKLFSKTVRSIEVEFDQEVGREKGSWKGGTLGCGYDLRRNETPIECLRRMESEREF